MSKADHLEWCKRRAHEYLDIGQIDKAMTSLVSDLSKHDGTADRSNSPLFLAKTVQIAISDDVAKARSFIDGIN